MQAAPHGVSGAAQPGVAADSRPPSLRSVWRLPLNAGTLGRPGRVRGLPREVRPVLALQATLEQNARMAKPALDLSKLTAEEKFELIDDLWESLAGDDVALTPEIDAELDRRLDRLERDGPTGVPWEDVRQEMTARKT